METVCMGVYAYEYSMYYVRTVGRIDCMYGYIVIYKFNT